jgi:hypothetical protein
MYRSLALKNRNSFTAATGEAPKMLGFLVHVKFSAGLVAMFGGLLAELSTTDAVSQGGLWIGIAGVITAFGAVIREWLGDREKTRVYQAAENQRIRDFEYKKLLLAERSDEDRRALVEFHDYAVAKHAWDVELLTRLAKIPDWDDFRNPPTVPMLPKGYAAATPLKELAASA